MLLRRVISHVRKQEWTAIGIDFVIVVAGVYIGVLLGNANEARQQRQLYEQSYDRMIAEQQGNLNTLERVAGELTQPLATVQLALEDLRACRTDDDALARVQAAFGPLGTRQAFDVQTTALDQLLDNDSFLRFQTPDLRDRLMALSARLRRAREASADVAGGTLDLFRDVDQGIIGSGPLVYSGPNEIVGILREGGTGSPQLVRPTELVMPLAEVCRNESFLNFVYSWEDNAYYQSIFSTMAATRLRADLEALGAPPEPAP
ncbi:MAG: hypothetical protein Q8S09_04505 [Hyphomonas sp.]|jgi:hypothetical protein|nr:hypothetical protein [Hyphomonas sp.]MDP3458518.1 hypothetical protein [Hyphomonas sp.]